MLNANIYIFLSSLGIYIVYHDGQFRRLKKERPGLELQLVEHIVLHHVEIERINTKPYHKAYMCECVNVCMCM